MLGIPKVPFYFYTKDPDSSKPILNTEYLSLHERFLDDRILFLFRKIDKLFVNRIRNIVLVLQYLDDFSDIVFLINSKGGDPHAALGLCDLMESLSCDVGTAVVGLAASEASLILAAGTISKRIAFPHARIMMVQPSLKNPKSKPKPRRGSFLIPFVSGLQSGPRRLRKRKRPKKKKLKELEILPNRKQWLKNAEQLRKLRNQFAELYAQKTDQPIDVVQNNLKRKTYMSPKEAQDYGIIDHIVQNSKKQYYK